MQNSVKYNRLTGFFSSSTLASAARGFSEFFLNNGQMKIVSSIEVQKEDFEIFEVENYQIPKEIEELIIKDLENLEDIMIKQHIAVLGWLLKENRLEIRFVVLLASDKIFHQKVGILEDKDGNLISFSGSINEGFSAWTGNIEEFKIHKGWAEDDSSEKAYFNSDIKKFNRYWELGRRLKSKTVSLTDALKDKVLKFTETYSKEELNKFLKKQYTDSSPGWKLRSYQEAALNQWVDYNYRAIINFETAGGKTITAIFCLETLFNNKVRNQKKNLLVSLVLPTNVIDSQWQQTINEFLEKNVQDEVLKNNLIIVDTLDNPKWSQQLTRAMTNLITRKNILLLVYFSYNTFGKQFKRMCEDLPPSTETLIIADEVHHIGAQSYKNSMDTRFQYRLGLSATPERKYDSEGSKAIIDFFEHIIFGLSYKDARKPELGGPFVSAYALNYFKIELNDADKGIYNELTMKIVRISSMLQKKDLNIQDRIRLEKKKEELLIKRADVIKNTDSKNRAIDKMVEILQENPNQRTLIFAPSNLFDYFATKLANAHLKYMPIIDKTLAENREIIIKAIKNNHLQVILAKEVLDEGLSIDNITSGMLIACDAVERQWVQRRGRIIRIDKDNPDKISQLYDIYISNNGKLFESEEKRLNFFKQDANSIKELSL